MPLRLALKEASYSAEHVWTAAAAMIRARETRVRLDQHSREREWVAVRRLKSLSARRFVNGEPVMLDDAADRMLPA